MQVANPNRAQFTKCAGYAIPYTTDGVLELQNVLVAFGRAISRGSWFCRPKRLYLNFAYSHKSSSFVKSLSPDLDRRSLLAIQHVLYHAFFQGNSSWVKHLEDGEDLKVSIESILNVLF